MFNVNLGTMGSGPCPLSPPLNNQQQCAVSGFAGCCCFKRDKQQAQSCHVLVQSCSSPELTALH